MRPCRSNSLRLALVLAVGPLAAAHAQGIHSASRDASVPVLPVRGAAAPEVPTAAAKPAQPSHRLVRRSRLHLRARVLKPRVLRHWVALPAASAIGSANAAARVDPDPFFWHNAIQQYAYADGALYQVYASPGRVTDIALQAGEELAGSGPVAAGDTVRWIIGDTVSGSGKSKQIHLLVKPTRPDLVTNLVINTDRRTYHLELRAQPATYMAALSWTYPQDALIALQVEKGEADRIEPVAAGLDASALNFRYRIDGDKASWRPLRVFDDGRQTFIEFPDGIATGDMPPVFVSGKDGSAELVNYRVKGRYMIVDRLFDAAELRLGTRKTQQIVRLSREISQKGQRP